MEATDRTRAATPATRLTGSALDLLRAALHAVESRDLARLREIVADDGVFVDPHYPVPRMTGWAAIGDGLRWSFSTIDTFRFDIVHEYGSSDGAHVAVEVDCHHVLRGGRALAFRQVFVADVREGRIVRLRAYEPYGPGGLVGWVLRLTRLGWRLGRRLRRTRARLPDR